MDRDKGGIPATSTIGESFENPFLTAALVAAFSWPAYAQQAVCGARDEIVSRLENGYQETASGAGPIVGGGAVIELYTSDAGTWTLVLTQPNGVSCLIAVGKNWETLKPKPTGPKT